MATGLQRCSAKLQTRLPDAFWDWLDQNPNVLLSVAATSFPVKPKTWQNLHALWEEFKDEGEDFRKMGEWLVGLAVLSFSKYSKQVQGYPIPHGVFVL